MTVFFCNLADEKEKSLPFVPKTFVCCDSLRREHTTLRCLVASRNVSGRLTLRSGGCAVPSGSVGGEELLQHGSESLRLDLVRLTGEGAQLGMGDNRS